MKPKLPLLFARAAATAALAQPVPRCASTHGTSGEMIEKGRKTVTTMRSTKSNNETPKARQS